MYQWQLSDLTAEQSLLLLQARCIDMLSPQESVFRVLSMLFHAKHEQESQLSKASCAKRISSCSAGFHHYFVPMAPCATPYIEHHLCIASRRAASAYRLEGRQSLRDRPIAIAAPRVPRGVLPICARDECQQVRQQACNAP